MDAAYNSVKKTVLFVVATALLLAAPICANAQAIVINPSFANNTIQISNSSCNNYQILNLTSTGTAIPITVSVSYTSLTDTNNNGLWLHARTDTKGPTTGGTGFTDTIPASTNTAGINLTIGMDRTIAPATDQAVVTLTPTSGSPIVITVNYVYNSSCGGNAGSITNGFITITPGTLTMTAPQGGSQALQLQVQNLTGSTIYFSAATPPGDTWLSTGSTLSTPVAGSSTATVNVTASAAGLNVTAYSSQVTVTSSSGASLVVTVAFTVTSGTGGSGTLTLDGGTATSRSFQYVSTGSVPGSSCINIVASKRSLPRYSDSFS